MQMVEASERVLDVLQLASREALAPKYKKDVHTCVTDLQEATDVAGGILDAVCREQSILQQQSEQLQAAIRQVLDSGYRFQERLCSFSSDVEPRVSASFEKGFQDIMRARGKVTHIREPFYVYERDYDEYACGNCDAGSGSYEGTCLALRVEFRDEDDIVHYESDVEELICSIGSCVARTLSKYTSALKKRLRVDGSVSPA